MLKIHIPGKIMLAGEWSILEQGNSCIVCPVKRGITTTIKNMNAFVFNAPDIGLKKIVGTWDGHNFLVQNKSIQNFDAKFRYCYYATQIALQFLQAERHKILKFEIDLKSNLSIYKNSSFIKFGLGSSSAVTVAICKSILALHGYDITSYPCKNIIFKLANIAHFTASGKIGSGFDIAASTFGETIVYKRFDPEFLKNLINTKISPRNIIDLPWPGLCIKKISMPNNLKTIIGFCGISSSTADAIKRIQKFKLNNLNCYYDILNQINYVVLELISSIEQNQQNYFLNLIRQNRQLLKELSIKSETNLENNELKKMIDLAESCGAAAKFSGAGGGDCAIALSFNNDTAQSVKNLWMTCSTPLQ